MEGSSPRVRLTSSDNRRRRTAGPRSKRSSCASRRGWGIEAREERRLLRWLTGRQIRNRLRAAIRRPIFWVLISLYGSIVAFFLWAALSAKASPLDPAQISFLGAWSLVASLLGFVPMAAVLGGFVLASRPRPVVEIVFPAPCHRSIFGQELVRRGIIFMSIGVIVMAALVGLVFSRLYTIPAWLGALRVAFVVLPIVGLWWLGGHFSFYLVSRRGGSLQ